MPGRIASPPPPAPLGWPPEREAAAAAPCGPRPTALVPSRPSSLPPLPPPSGLPPSPLDTAFGDTAPLLFQQRGGGSATASRLREARAAAGDAELSMPLPRGGRGPGWVAAASPVAVATLVVAATTSSVATASASPPPPSGLRHPRREKPSRPRLRAACGDESSVAAGDAPISSPPRSRGRRPVAPRPSPVPVPQDEMRPEKRERRPTPPFLHKKQRGSHAAGSAAPRAGRFRSRGEAGERRSGSRRERRAKHNLLRAKSAPIVGM